MFVRVCEREKGGANSIFSNCYIPFIFYIFCAIMRTGYKKVNVMCRTETHRKLINLTFLKIVKLIKTNFAQIYIDRDHD